MPILPLTGDRIRHHGKVDGEDVEDHAAVAIRRKNLPMEVEQMILTQPTKLVTAVMETIVKPCLVLVVVVAAATTAA